MNSTALGPEGAGQHETSLCYSESAQLKTRIFYFRNFHVPVSDVLVTLHLLGQNKGKSYLGSQSWGIQSIVVGKAR